MVVLILCQRIVTTSWILSQTNKNIIATFCYKSKMSTSSSATASDRNPVTTDDPTLEARMCVFIIMQKDGTVQCHLCHRGRHCAIMYDIGAH